MMSEPFDPRLLESLRGARHIAVLTGAGISAESGIPTFRDAQTGLWARFRPEELAIPEAFRRNPQLVWDWYEWRRNLVRNAAPNAGHRALARLESLVPRFSVITQNVDGLHQRAGSRAVIELHGNIGRNRCFAENVVVEGAATGRPPRCANCGAYLRPDVVWFGETLPRAALAEAEEAAQLPVSARESGAVVIEINKDPTPLTALATFSLRDAAGAILPPLLEAAWPEAGRRMRS
jgi:NAD-dependent deacetylase